MKGLSSHEALARLKTYGPNSIPEENNHFLASFLKKFWAPIPWMLEGIIALEIIIKKPAEAGIIFILLLFNVAMSFLQETRAKKAIQLLRKRLSISARVLRDEKWNLLPAQELVPDDCVRIRAGDIIPADVKILDGQLLIDQSVLTGESLPIEAVDGAIGYAGAVVDHGEAFAQVIATGIHSYYGKTAEIVRSARAPSHLETIIYQIIKYLVSFDVILVLIVSLYSIYFHLPLLELIPFSLLLLAASVPVALPATFTLATALGSLELAKSGVMVTHLSAIENAAAMTILCIDKTGTITKNCPEVSAVRSYSPYSEEDVLAFAYAASEESTQDPLDLAILKRVKKNSSSIQRLRFIPFNPHTKSSEAVVRYCEKMLHIRKGAPKILLNGNFSEEVEMLGKDGSRILCVTADDQLAGLISLRDPLREDSEKTIREIKNLGIRVILLTGDSEITARTVANQAGIGNRVIERDHLENILEADAVAGMFPEDKFRIIEILQKQNRICGMTGDGVNDAPALKKAEVGIAVANAADIAKASASLVLTETNLANILEAIKTSRKIYQRMLTYIFNKIIKTLEISILLGIGLILMKNFIISQLLIVLLLFANDFVTMSLATDRVSYSQKPDHWDIKNLMQTGGIFAALTLGFAFSALIAGSHFLTLPFLQTLIFLTLVFTGQVFIYSIRERNHFWHSRPSFWLLGCSIADIAIFSLFAYLGIFMAPLPGAIIIGLLGSVLIYYFLIDFIKVKILTKAINK